MANDDDLIKQQGEDFNLNDDEADFTLPDDPADQSDEHGYVEDDIELGLGSGDDEELAFDDEEFDIANQDNPQPDEIPEQEIDPDQEENEEPKHKMGWKTYAGLALSVVIVAGGLSYMVLPSDKPNPRANQNTEQAREIIRQRAEQSLAQSNQTSAPSAQAPRPPVEVQAFPGASAGPDMASQTALNAQAETPQTPPQIPPVSDGNSGNGGSSAGDQGFAVIPDPAERRNTLDDGTPADSASPQRLTGLNEFKALSDLANQNDRRITVLEKSKGEKTELSNLEVRVLEIEKKLDKLIAASTNNNQDHNRQKTQDTKAEKPEQKPKETKVSKASKSSPETTASSGPVDYKPKVPKTLEEVKALQRQLAMYGYRPGKIDGLIGRATRDAVKRVQREHGLPVNGWLNLETLNVLVNPKHYSGSYPPAKDVKYADHPRDEKTHQATWYVRGVTPSKAVVYRLDGMSYAVSIGTEIPGMGQVTALDPGNHEVRTAQGTIGKRAAR